MTPAITMNGLGKRYGAVDALIDLHLEVPAGSVFGFLGPNGAGKTTALKILAGLTRADAGTAFVDGIPVDMNGSHRSHVGYLAQDPRFYGWMTGRETLEYVAGFYPAAQGGRGTAELLDLVGLADAADRATKTYSGGMRQRLGIAQALVGNPAVVLLDEPAAALDPIGRRDVLALLRRLRGETTVFYSTHILDDVQKVSDHVAILDAGRLVVSAPTEALMRRAAAGTVRVALLGADDATASRLAAVAGVSRVTVLDRQGAEWRYELSVAEGMTGAVQRAVMRLAADGGLVVTTNHEDRVDLESVFLSIVNEERAA